MITRLARRAQREIEPSREGERTHALTITSQTRRREVAKMPYLSQINEEKNNRSKRPVMQPFILETGALELPKI